MLVAIQPSSSKDAKVHFDDTVRNAVDINSYRSEIGDDFDDLSQLAPEGELSFWGVKSGKNDSNLSKFMRLSSGDLVVFTGGKKAHAVGRIIHVFRNRDFARSLWGADSEGNTWELMYALDDIRFIDLSYDQVRIAIGSKGKDNFMGFRVLDDHKSEGLSRLLANAAIARHPRYWWVNQGKTYRDAIASGLLWSPKTAEDGRSQPAYRNMTQLEPGDVVYSYSGGSFRAKSIVQERAVSGRKPAFARSSSSWSEDGWLVKVDYAEFPHPIEFEMHREKIAQLAKHENSPIGRDGKVNQAYLFEIDRELAEFLDALNSSTPETEKFESSPKSWIFQANPKMWSLVDFMDSETRGRYAMNQHWKDIRPGDEIWFRNTGKEAGLYALGKALTLAEEVGNGFGDWTVEFEITDRIEPPLLRAATNTDPILGGISALRGRQYTNALITDRQSEEIHKLAGDRLVPVSVGRDSQGTGTTGQSTSKRTPTMVSDPNAVLEAMREFDLLGRTDFLKKYEFGKSRTYFIEHEGSDYDSKAILGAAFGFQFGKSLTPSEFSGGERSTVAVLRKLGFDVYVATEPIDVDEVSVRRAIDECLAVGNDVFLQTWGQKAAAKFDLMWKGQPLPAKAILAVAEHFKTEEPVRAAGDWQGRRQTVAQPLIDLGFEVEVRTNPAGGQAEAKPRERGLRLVAAPVVADVAKVRGKRRKPQRDIDYDAHGQRARKVGLAGELLVLDFLEAQLTNAGRPDLVEKIEHTSVVTGDGAGYDIKSYTETGSEIFIEVKTTTKLSDKTPFLMSSNEWEFLKENVDSYRLFRVYNFDAEAEAGELFELSAGEVRDLLFRQATEFRFSWS